ncbi:hypothetical protein SUGI_0799440 [Cryptomeria japonica]|uniref:uncharacterized protein LOC131046363 n=1 Tax=Cryptomeria japonica TaxID=3369 RepID=UPI0024149EB6|nr:uncharacterized protein LOC131046363 [Cryptomeria japonica]GLJ39203.1 hypothetical protein SUGI_0799440 [Cryptomeria japonica]
MDERLANIFYSQQLQEKQQFKELLEAQSVSNAKAEFRRRLKELIRNHLNTCMTLASCSNSDEPNDASICGSYHMHQWRLKHVREACNICRFQDLLQQDEDEDEDEEGEQLLCRQHSSNNGQDSIESSAARRRQSRILNRWAARQAQEMITTMERQTREAELISLAGLQTVSTRDCSFLRESSPSRSVRSVERPSTRASTLVQMWRELEGESRVNSSRERNRIRMSVSEVAEPRRERARNHASPCASNIGRRDINSFNNNTNDNDSLNQSNELRENSEGNRHPSQERESEFNIQTNNDAGVVQNRHEMYRDQENGQSDRQNCQSELNFRREQSLEDGEGERERVRHIVRSWMTGSTPLITHNCNRRAIFHAEIEQERGRDLSQEWVHVTNQQPDASGNMRQHSQRQEIQPGLVYRQTREREAVQGQAPVHLAENQQDYVNRNAPRLRGRQAIIDLLVRIVRERQRELERLLEHRAVSHFSHRNRIQSLLRGRFLRGRALSEEQRSSTAAGELGQLRLRGTVSGLREGFRTGLNNTGGQDVNDSNVSENQQSNGSTIHESNVLRGTEITQNESHSDVQESNQAANRVDQRRDIEEIQNGNSLVSSMGWQEAVIQHEDGDWQRAVSEEDSRNTQENNLEGRQREMQEYVSEGGYEDWQEGATQGVEMAWDGILDDVDRHWQRSGSDMDGDWRRDASHDANGDWQEDPSPDINVDWQGSASQELVRDWQDQSQGASRSWEEIPTARGVSDFQSLEEATAYNMELRELLSRRSVSTVLASEFRERMDQLILSYLQNQGRPPIAWDLQEQEQEPEEQEDVGQNESPFDIRDGPVFISPPPPPPPPPHQLWRHEIRRQSRSRSSLQHPEMEWEAINDLRSEIARLQQGMSDLQHMVETCMDMQLELQRSVRQEVSAALNRSNGGQDLPEEVIDGSKWVAVRKGICCICCDRQIDSLLYRCGHMCTCSKCANELVHNSGKCPMCRAPIVEVVRAYCEV